MRKLDITSRLLGRAGAAGRAGGMVVLHEDVEEDGRGMVVVPFGVYWGVIAVDGPAPAGGALQRHQMRKMRLEFRRHGRTHRLLLSFALSASVHAGLRVAKYRDFSVCG